MKPRDGPKRGRLPTAPARSAWSSEPPLRENQFASWALAGLAFLTISLRLVPVLLVPSIDYADEIFQTMEPAHRIVYATGLVTWEFQLGARSWLLPGGLAGLMQVARLLGDGPRFYLPVIAIALGTLAALPVACCFGWARHRFGLAGAIVAGFTVAVAPELVYFGARPLSEVIAAHLMVGAAYWLDPLSRELSRRRLLGAGVLLGLSAMLRIQLAPTIVLIGLWGPFGDWRVRLPPILTGGVLALLAAGFLDAATLGYPFASVWRNVVYNVAYGVSDTFGVEPWNYYIRGEAGLWGIAFVPLLLIALLGARQVPALMAAALITLGVHAAIAHKEYRFIYPALLLGAVLTGLGLAQIAAWATSGLTRRGVSDGYARLVFASLAIGIWGDLSLQVWTAPTLTNLRHRAHDGVVAADFVARMPDVCGIGLYYGMDNGWVFGGYTHFHHPVPIFWPANPVELADTTPGFNVLVSVPDVPGGLGFKSKRCFGEVCVSQRVGACVFVASKTMPFPDALERLRPASPPSFKTDAVGRSP